MVNSKKVSKGVPPTLSTKKEPKIEKVDEPKIAKVEPEASMEHFEGDEPRIIVEVSA